MIRYERDGMLANAASVKPMASCPDWAGQPCITARPNQIKKEEPEAGTSGLLGRKSSTLNRNVIEQNPEVGKKHSALTIPIGSALVDELESELNTTKLGDESIGIRSGETVSGTLEARNAGTHWRFLDEQLNFIEPGLSYHGEFIARVVTTWAEVAYLALIAWRPIFGKRQEYTRFARFSRGSFKPIRLWDAIVPKLSMKVGDLIEFVAKATVYTDHVDFQTPISRLRLLQPKGSEESKVMKAEAVETSLSMVKAPAKDGGPNECD